MEWPLILRVCFDVAGSEYISSDRQPQFFIRQFAFITRPMYPFPDNTLQATVFFASETNRWLFIFFHLLTGNMDQLSDWISLS
jgi:hypothetical protein